MIFNAYKLQLRICLKKHFLYRESQGELEIKLSKTINELATGTSVCYRK